MWIKTFLIPSLIILALWSESIFAKDPPYDAKRIYEWNEIEDIPLPIVLYYPEIKRRCVSGFVEVGFQVKKNGKVQKTRVLSSGPTEKNDKTVVRAIKRFVWKPGVIDKKPVFTKGHRIKAVIDCESGKVNYEESQGVMSCVSSQEKGDSFSCKEISVSNE